MNSGNPVVDEIGQINFQGNVIPSKWFSHILYPGGRPNVVAIMILSEIIYWYRPTIIRDENNGNVVQVKKKFKADMLQRDYQSFANQFGFSNGQVKAAIDKLVEMKLIKREFRTIRTTNGRKLNNVIFLEPIAGNIKLVTFLDEPYYAQKDEGNSGHAPSSNETEETGQFETTPSLVQTEEPPQIEKGTCTEITTEITTGIAAANSAHTREGESDGVLTTDPLSGDQQGTVAEISHTPEAEKALLDHFISLRGYGFDASADDVAAAKEILSAGVTLQDALVWLSQRFERYKPKHPRDRINSLSYCVGFILDKHVEKLKLSEDEERGTGEKIHKPSTGVRRSAPKAESITGNQVGRIRRKKV